jgi:hypothetical protein
MRVIKEKKTMDLIAAFCLFVRSLPLDFALLGGTGNRLKSKTTAKLKEKKPRSPRSETHYEHLPSSRPPPSFSIQTTLLCFQAEVTDGDNQGHIRCNKGGQQPTQL